MKSRRAPGLYVHVPFCRSKCPYCGFFSVASASPVSRWLQALKEEMQRNAGRLGTFDTLYVGGGTPTSLSSPVLESLVTGLNGHFAFAPDTERTIEANPCDLTLEKARRLRRLGFNRVSLGVQSFDERTLLSLGRGHRGEDAEAALQRLRTAGFENIGVDLIYGVDAQSLSSWMETLRRAVQFGPEHISCYQLTFEKGTPLGRLKEKGVAHGLDEKGARAFFLATCRYLEAQGYIHYEVSNFARERRYLSRHNAKYWDHTPYLGLGPSAHSFDGAERWWNVPSIRKYCDALEQGRSPVQRRECLTGEQLRLEAICLGARTQRGVDLETLLSAPGSRRMLTMLEGSGHLRVRTGRAVPTRKGLLVADHIPRCFWE